MKQDGIDISHKTPRSVFDLYKAGKTYTSVITVCSREAEGSKEEKLAYVRPIRDQIRERARQFVKDTLLQ